MKNDNFDEQPETVDENAVSADISAENEPPTDDDKSSISSDLIRGHINTIILRSLYDRDKYGYEIMSDIEEKSHGQYSLKQPTLYSALKRLENQGYIKAFWKTDEVSAGGRRKYFTLTESGKEIAEKNLAEWEYSRTIIDSLISDKSFDFTRPAPTPVDFTILRNSVSRVPVVHTDTDGSESATEDKPQSEAATQEQTAQQTVQEPAAQEQAAQQPLQEQVLQEQVVQQIVQEVVQQVVQQQESSAREQAQPVPESAQEQAAQQPAPPPAPQPDPLEESRRIAHENYLRLISEPVSEPQPQRSSSPILAEPQPQSGGAAQDTVLYTSKPQTERDYKFLISGLFAKAMRNGSTQDNLSDQPTAQVYNTYPDEQPRIVDRGRVDGVRVVASEHSERKSAYATKTTYNKGFTLFKCSAIVFFVLLVEFAFTMIFKDNLGVNIFYPLTILIIGLVQFAVFGIIALKGYGVNSARPTTSVYLNVCTILTIIAILIICLLAPLLHINYTVASDIVKLMVIPSITALNLILFAVSFKLMVK